MFRSMYLLLPHGVMFTCIICITMGQEFTVVPEPVKNFTGDDYSIELIWDFENGGITLSGATWQNGNNELLMRKIGNQSPEVLNEFIGKVSYHSLFGLSVRNLTKEDEGEYTCRVSYSSGQKESKVNVTLYDVFGVLAPTTELYGGGEQIGNGSNVIVKSILQTRYFVPIQDPVAIVTSISTDFNGIVEKRGTCNDNNGTYCEATYIAPNQTGELIISVCNSHPALKEELCERLAVNIMDLPMCQSCKNGGTCNQATLKCICLDGFTGDTCEIDPQEDKCKWWCILIIVLVVVSVVVIIIICCCWHYKVACFAHKSSAQIDVNQKQETNGFGMENKAY